MQASQWIQLIQTIPLEYHNGMSVVTTSGLEINVNSFVRLDDHFIVCRGRAMAATEGGLIFFVPYDQIACMGYSKTLREELVQAWFQEGSGHAVVEEQPVTAESVEISEGEAVPAEAPAPVPSPGPQPTPVAAPAAAPPKPVAPARRPAVSSAPPQPVAQASPQGPVPITSGLALPAKAAMIERLRKRALDASSPGTSPKPPEQK